jgi:histone acetyltransferase (RNA polymerase elongator complex component)
MSKQEKRQRHYNIPIFIPQLACPHRCIYCNQHYISGQMSIPTLEEVKNTIEKYLSTIKESSFTEVAFFGGSFTGLNLDTQTKYLEVVQPYLKENKVQAIRLSTRPDYINEEILDNLKLFGVKDIELGAQSLDDEVLSFVERGHNAKDVENASKMINSYGFNLGLQMMIGLPLDTIEKSKQTAKKILVLGAKSTRIYPTLVIENTPLATLFREKKYKPLTIEEAVEWTKEVYKIFLNKDITVLRVGLHPSKDILSGKGFLAGPFHVSFFELVLTSLWKDKFSDKEFIDNFSSCKAVTIKINPNDVAYAVGYNSSNKKFLENINPNVKFLQDKDIKEGNFSLL